MLIANPLRKQLQPNIRQCINATKSQHICESKRLSGHTNSCETSKTAWLAKSTQVALSHLPTFFDFCAGIGSTRLAFERCNAQCVGFSEIDSAAEETYRLLHGDEEPNFGDLMEIEAPELPDFDIMLGGFPCQTFSIMGKRLGFEDSRGLVFEGLTRILLAKRPAAFMLENVKGLLSHDHGRTFRIIFQTLADSGYQVNFRVMRSSDFGIPQMRERCFLVGFRDHFIDFQFPQSRKCKESYVAKFLIDDSPEHEFELSSARGKTFLGYLENKYNSGRFQIEQILNEEDLILDTRQSDLRLYHDAIPTLRTGRHGIMYVRNGKLRCLSGFEALLLQGFPKYQAAKASRHIANTKLLAQAGNAMTVNVVEAIAERMLSLLGQPLTATSLAA